MKSISNILRLFAVAIVLMVSTTATVAAQDKTSSENAYIYCRVTFDDFKVQKEKQIHNYTQKYTERAYKMSVDCRQYDDDLTYIFGVINDENGQPREFRSYMAGLNWLGRMGWEMLPYPTSYRSDMNLDQVYWFRMDVSGLSADQINAKLAPLRPSKE
jgi:hypothetical protein